MYQAIAVEKSSMPIIVQKNIPAEKKISTDIQFISQVCYLGLVQGFHEKMVDEVIQRIMADNKLSHKMKKKRKKETYEGDKLIRACMKVIKESSGIIGTMPYFVLEEDIERIWLTIDKFITKYIMPHSFISAIGFFAAIGEAVDSGICKTAKLQEYLFEVSEEISDEYFHAKLEKAKKSGIEYDRFVYKFFEKTEMDQAVKVSDIFLKIFTSRDTFEAYAARRYKEMDHDTLSTFKKLFPNSVLTSSIH